MVVGTDTGTAGTHIASSDIASTDIASSDIASSDIASSDIASSDIASSDIVDKERADRLFHALADATRRDIVTCAMRGEHSVSALARRYPMSFAAVQKHVAVLERAELVTKRRQGREQLVSGNIDTVRDAFGVLERLEAVWRARIDRFGDVLAGLTVGATE